MRQIKVLIVDDSSFVRKFIVDVLSSDSEIKVVGEAENGKQAVDMALALKPDVVTMDIEMPVMDGFEAIETIMAYNAVPILVFTSKGDAETAYSAISKGALEVLPKPDVDPDSAENFIREIKILSKVKVISHIRGGKTKLDGLKTPRPVLKKRRPGGIIAIASSTGGPRALSVILPELPKDFLSPIVIAQHIPQDFVIGMADWLNRITHLTVKRGEEGESIKPGTVYISPSRKNMIIDNNKNIVFIEKKPNEIYFPSCDILLSSVAGVYGADSVGVILTGMGNDGVKGLQSVKSAGGITIAQDEETSTVFGMPKAAIEDNCVDTILPLNEISGSVISLVMGGLEKK